MKKYRVILSRNYLVEAEANNKNNAKRFAEFYVGGEKDLSIEKDRRKKKFKINEIEMTINNAICS
jgi:hypothetical protein